MPIAFKTSYTVFGLKDAMPVVLVHGLGLNQHMWRWLLPLLAEKHRVITYDLAGHGETPMPDTAASLDLFAKQLLAVLDAADVREAVITGFSLGGMIARKFAQTHPDRTRALCILHSPHRRTADAQAAIEKRVEQARLSGPAATVEAAIDRWFTPTFCKKAPAVIEEVKGWVLANDPQIYPSNYAVLAHGTDEVIAPEPPIATPTLVLTADEDFGNGPEMTQAIAAEIHGAQQVILKGLRHMAPAEAPEETARPILRFLDELKQGHGR